MTNLQSDSPEFGTYVASLSDVNGLVIFCHGTGVPTASVAGCAVGALAINESNGAVYANTGTTTSATWTLIGTVTAGSVGTTQLANGGVTLAKLATGVSPSDVAKFGAQYTTSGGAAAEAITVTGLAATDLPLVQLVSAGSNNVSVVKAVATLNTLTVTFSGDPGNDAVINYVAFRAAS